MKSRRYKNSVFFNLIPHPWHQERQSITTRSLFNWFKHLSPNASIQQKIGVGYGLSLGIAILGTIAGLGIGEHYQSIAITEIAQVRQQEYLLKELQMSIVQARAHESRFAVVLGNRVWLLSEQEKFRQNINQAKQLLVEAQRFVNTPKNQATADINTLQDLLKTTAITVDAYDNFTNSLLEQIHPWDLKQDQILPTQQQLLRNSSSEIAMTLDQLFQQLDAVIDTAQTQDIQSASALEKAGKLRVGIIFTSMLLSVAIAAALALYTSRAIAQPIESVTRVAQQVTEASNFTLRAPVTTGDEVGVLATSLNQLIQRMATYTQELKQAQAQLIQTEKMSSLGAMVAGVAHEINNPINFIYGNLEYTSEYVQDLLTLLRLYQQHYPEPQPLIQDHLEDIDFEFLIEDLPKILASMKGGADRIREIVLALRNFSRIDETGRKAVNIHEGIDNTLLILNSRLKNKIEVIKHYGELPLIECSPAQLNQVFMNLLSNAIDALESHWSLVVGHWSFLEEKTTKDHGQRASPTIWISTEVSSPNWVTLIIADNGNGIPAAIQDRVFDPFFTTKEPGKGTGLGLAISYQIITQHQGKIKVNSALGQGAKFIIMLPLPVSRRTST